MKIILVAGNLTGIREKIQRIPHETADKMKKDPIVMEMDQEIGRNNLEIIEDEVGKAAILPVAPGHLTVMTTEGEEIKEDAAMIEDKVRALAGTEVKGQAKARRRNPINSAKTKEPLGEKCSKGLTMRKKCEDFTKCCRFPGTSSHNL